MTLAILDCETTGLKWYKNGIVSLGAVDINSNDKFYEECKVDDSVEVENESLKVNGFTSKDVKDPRKLTEKEVLIDFLKWLKYHKVNVVSGFNVAFDISFMYGISRRYSIDFSEFPPYYFDIKEIFERNVLSDISNMNFIDSICNKYNINVGKPPYVHISMDKTLKFYDIDEDEPKPHLAINGAIFATELYFLIKYKTHYLERFADIEIPDYLNKLKFEFGPASKVSDLVDKLEVNLSELH